MSQRDDFVDSFHPLWSSVMSFSSQSAQDYLPGSERLNHLPKGTQQQQIGDGADLKPDSLAGESGLFFFFFFKSLGF